MCQGEEKSLWSDNDFKWVYLIQCVLVDKNTIELKKTHSRIQQNINDVSWPQYMGCLESSLKEDLTPRSTGPFFHALIIVADAFFF